MFHVEQNPSEEIPNEGSLERLPYLHETGSSHRTIVPRGTVRCLVRRPRLNVPRETVLPGTKCVQGLLGKRERSEEMVLQEERGSGERRVPSRRMTSGRSAAFLIFDSMRKTCKLGRRIFSGKPGNPAPVPTSASRPRSIGTEIPANMLSQKCRWRISSGSRIAVKLSLSFQVSRIFI